MELMDIMKLENFVVVGNTINEDKYAHKIKTGLIKAGYNVECVGKELGSINDVSFDIDVLCLCIHPALGIDLLKKCHKSIKIIVIQPGAESAEIFEYLDKSNIDYIQGCLLVGLKLYKK